MASLSALSFRHLSPVDLSRGSLIKSGMWPLCVVEVDVTAEPTLQGSRAVVAPQVDVLVLQRPPQSLDEDIVEGPAVVCSLMRLSPDSPRVVISVWGLRLPCWRCQL